MTPLSPGKRAFQLKARQVLTVNSCHCWDCLRRAGITPARASHNSHRLNILGITYNPSTGNPE